MADRTARTTGSASPKGSLTSAAIVEAGLDALDFGFAIFDQNLKLIVNNEAFIELRG